MPGPRTDQAKSPLKRPGPMAQCIAGVHLATRKPNKKCNKLSKLSQSFRSTSWCAWRSGKYMEVQADAAVLLHDHHSLQFDCRESYVLLSFTSLIILVAGNPTGGLHVTSSTDFKRWRGDSRYQINASGIHPESRISNVLSNVWSLHPRHVKMHTPYHHHRHQIYGTCLLQDDIFWNDIARRKSFDSTPTHLWFYWIFLRRGSWVSPRALLGHSTWEIYMNANTPSSTLAVQDDSNKTRLWPWLLIYQIGLF